MGWCMRRRSSALTSFSVPCKRVRIVCRKTVNRPLLLFFRAPRTSAWTCLAFPDRFSSQRFSSQKEFPTRTLSEFGSRAAAFSFRFQLKAGQLRPSHVRKTDSVHCRHSPRCESHALAVVAIVFGLRGTRALMVVPCPGFESIESRPRTNFSRSFMLVRPRPCPPRAIQPSLNHSSSRPNRRASCKLRDSG
jgi:hypothetical protein